MSVVAVRLFGGHFCRFVIFVLSVEIENTAIALEEDQDQMVRIGLDQWVFILNKLSQMARDCRMQS